MTIERFGNHDQRELVSQQQYYQALNGAMAGLGKIGDRRGEVTVITSGASSSLNYRFSSTGNPDENPSWTASLKLNMISIGKKPDKDTMSTGKMVVERKANGDILISNEIDALSESRVSPLEPQAIEDPRFGGRSFHRETIGFSLILSEDGGIVISHLTGVRQSVDRESQETPQDGAGKMKIARAALDIVVPEVLLYAEAIASGNIVFVKI